MKIFKIEAGRWTGEEHDIDDLGVPDGWTNIEPPELIGTEQALWFGGEWVIETESEVAARLLLEYNIKLEYAKLALCTEIDTERDSRQASDFEFDFGDSFAVLDNFSFVRAGVRNLQMADRNKRDWMAQQVRSLAAKEAGDLTATIVARCEDNANVLSNPVQFGECFEAGAARDQALMAYAATRKTAVKAETTVGGVESTKVFTGANWPS